MLPEYLQYDCFVLFILNDISHSGKLEMLQQRFHFAIGVPDIVVMQKSKMKSTGFYSGLVYVILPGVRINEGFTLLVDAFQGTFNER